MGEAGTKSGVLEADQDADLSVNLEWCSRLPKVELHAHLNGSVRDSTLLELAAEHKRGGTISFDEVAQIVQKEIRTLEDCFKLFDLIHVLTTSHAVITRITKEVLEDFAAENVVYLELRTTPKKNAAAGISKLSYMHAVLDGVKSAGSKTHVRLLLSIDRREDAEAAKETVQLALELREFGVVGVDLSGDPRKGSWCTFLPALTYAREQGLPVTLHCGEVHNPEEVDAMLSFHPERVGHACVLQDAQWEKLFELKIPVEVCFTSNILTKCVESIADHHFANLYKGDHPIVICTDDRGVFSTSVSAEYALAATNFGLSNSQLFYLAKRACNFAFADASTKHHLRQLFDAFEASMLGGSFP